MNFFLKLTGSLEYVWGIQKSLLKIFIESNLLGYRTWYHSGSLGGSEVSAQIIFFMEHNQIV